MEDYLQILKGLKNSLSGMSSEEIEALMKFIIIGAIGGCLFLIYFVGKIFFGIKASITAFIDGFRGKK